MIREEEIIKAARTAEKQEFFHPSILIAKGVNSAYGIGFIEGALWADKTMIVKALKWLKDKFEVEDYYDKYDIDGSQIFNYIRFINDFKNIMTE